MLTAKSGICETKLCKKYSHVMPTHIASCQSYCFRLQSLFWFPPQPLQRLNGALPPPILVWYSVWCQLSMEVRGGGSDKRVSQASASSVVRLDEVPCCIDETLKRHCPKYCLHPVLVAPGGTELPGLTLHRKDSYYRKNGFHDSVQQDQPLRRKINCIGLQ